MTEEDELRKEVKNLKGALRGAVKILKVIMAAAHIDLDAPVHGLPPQFTVNAVLKEWERIASE